MGMKIAVIIKCDKYECERGATVEVGLKLDDRGPMFEVSQYSDYPEGWVGQREVCDYGFDPEDMIYCPDHAPKKRTKSK